MVKFEFLDKEKNISMLSFSTMQMPTFRVDKYNGWVEFGKKNDFPNQLLRLYEEHSENGAIIGSKANYLLGEGIIAKNKEQQQIVDAFLTSANRYESWEKLNDKIKVDAELFNAFYLQIITDLTGKPKEFYHLQYANCRVSEDKNTLYYSDNFLDNKCEKKQYSIYEESKVGVFFMRFEFYKPTTNKLASVYPLPQYIGCIKDISTDIDISTFNNNYVANGFSAGTLITFFNGEPTPDQKREIKKRLLETHSSPDRAGSIVVNYAEKDGQAAQITALNVDDLDKKFEFTSKRALEKILRGHNVTNPELFGVKTEGQLGTRVSLSESYELMINTYTKPRQKSLCLFYSELIYLTLGQKVELEIKQLKPIGLDLTNDADLTQDERRALKGYEPLTAPKLDVNGQPTQAETFEANENISGLSRKQFNNMNKIVSDFEKGKLNQERAVMNLIHYGMSENDAKRYLGVQFSNQEDSVYLAFENCAKSLNFEYESLFEEDAHINNSTDALNYALKAQRMYFANVMDISVTDLDNAVLNAIKGNPTVTNKDLAKQLQVEESKILESLNRLTEKELIEVNAYGYEATTKALKKVTEPIEATEIKTIYTYAVKASAPSLSPGGSSRPFCRKMMILSNNGKYWEFEDIDRMSNSMGMNAWDYRGGFYNNPETGETEPFCRHIWKAKTIKVKKK